jgi:hypothetical protein
VVVYENENVFIAEDGFCTFETMTETEADDIADVMVIVFIE